MDRKWFALGCYVVSFLLLAFYIAVLLSSVNPRVSIEYNMFYIEHKLAYYLADGELQDYGVNEEFVYVPDGKYRNQGMGWSPLTQAGIWTQEKEAYLYFYIDEKKEAGYQLKMYTQESAGKQLQIYANGNLAEKKKIGDDGMIKLHLSSSELLEGVNEIKIVTEYGRDKQENILVNAAELAEN